VGVTLGVGANVGVAASVGWGVAVAVGRSVGSADGTALAVAVGALLPPQAEASIVSSRASAGNFRRRVGRLERRNPPSQAGLLRCPRAAPVLIADVPGDMSLSFASTLIFPLFGYPVKSR